MQFASKGEGMSSKLKKCSLLRVKIFQNLPSFHLLITLTCLRIENDTLKEIRIQIKNDAFINKK